jgi:uncharacterized protein YjbI with pentapeptide repeats
MKVKNLTGFPFGPKLTARKPPQKEMALCVRGAFSLRPGEPLVPFDGLLAQGAMRGEELRPGDDDRKGEPVHADDFADFKPRAEVLLRGHCYTPGRRPMKECPVKLAVGGWSKLLRVVGPRAWSDGLIQATTEPLPFTRVALTYENAYGGPGYARNPSGKGFGMLELPLVEGASAPLRSRSDRPEPASFAPLSSQWPQRSGKVGKEYGASWRKTRAPFYAEDFDWTYFQAAPPDQWLDGYLRGDEEVSLTNLHEAAPSLSVKLPALRIRAFVKDDRGEIRELKMVLDTLFLSPDEGRVELTWRGHTPVREDDFDDIAILLLASEPLAEEPRPAADYQARIEAFEKDPLGAEELIQKHVPKHLRDAARKTLRGEDPVPKPDKDAPPAEAMAAFLQNGAGLPEAQAKELQRGLEQAIARTQPRPDRAGPSLDLGGQLAAALAGAAPSGGGQPSPKAVLGEAFQKVAQQLAAIKQKAAAANVPVKGAEQLEALLADPRLQKVDPSIVPPGQPPAAPPPEPGPGVDCTGRDLRGKDLSGRDLSGAIFKEADLSEANLQNANLTGAVLDSAVLVRADLRGATLDRADLTRTNLSEADAGGASFRGAAFKMAISRKTRFAGAVLDESTADVILVQEADMSGARARGARWRKVVVHDSVLEGADFSEAKLDECYFLKSRAAGLIARGALLPRTSFGDSDLTSAVFAGARGERSIWSGAVLSGTDFTLAVLPNAMLIRVKGAKTRFFGANLRGSRFYRAELTEADLEKANLAEVDFCKAILHRVRFRDANLYSAKFLGSSGADADFTGANQKRAIFEQP